ncbi:MAG TPA: hypothetical protein VEW66_01720 [Thermomicrobiales bacterium]|nr:hypothetical protein [Thermomicrobiales bacterium]
MHGSLEKIPVAFEQGEFVSRQATWGAMNIAFEQAPLGMDSRPLFHGLPGDACQCPHWGYVISGTMRVIYADREEVIGAGEAYYLAPGHNVVCDEAGSIVEFSPVAEYRTTMEAVAARTTSPVS